MKNKKSLSITKLDPPKCAHCSNHAEYCISYRDFGAPIYHKALTAPNMVWYACEDHLRLITWLGLNEIQPDNEEYTLVKKDKIDA